jgi:protein CpxP
MSGGQRRDLWRNLQMTNASVWPVRAIMTVGVMSALALGSPAANASTWVLAQSAPAPGAPSVPPGMPQGGNAGTPRPHGPAEVSDARITELRTKLQVTAAEEPQFSLVANVMHANAQSMEALLADREKDPDRTAVSALRWYQRLTEAHAEALKKFVPAFEALYAALSDSQRKTADVMFQQFAQRPLPHKPQ